jgi:periplasmic protein TonB
MLNVLLESKARRTQRLGGTVASTLVHVALVAGAVMITVQPSPGDAKTAPPKTGELIYIPIPEKPQPSGPTASQRHPPASTSAVPQPPRPVLTFNGPDVPVIREVVQTTMMSPTDDFGPGVQTHGPIGAPPGLGGPGDIVEERFVDRSPRLIGNPAQPTFPLSLRQSGRGGRVLVQFVVDTTGRAEMDGFKVMETTDPLFAESVRNVLPRYRFSPGEAGGRRVRTLVQLPFDFTLLR